MPSSKTLFSLSLSLPPNSCYTYSDPLHGVIYLGASNDLATLKYLIVRFKGNASASIPIEAPPADSLPTFYSKHSQDLFDYTLGLVNTPEPLSQGTHDWDFDFEWPDRGSKVLISSFEYFFSGADIAIKYELVVTACVIDARGKEQVLEAKRNPDFVDSRGEESAPADFAENTVKLERYHQIRSALASFFIGSKKRLGLSQQALSPIAEETLSATLQTPNYVLTRSPFMLLLEISCPTSDNTAWSTGTTFKIVHFELSMKGNLQMGDWDLYRENEPRGICIWSTDKHFDPPPYLEETMKIVTEPPIVPANTIVDLAEIFNISMRLERASFNLPFGGVDDGGKLSAKLSYSWIVKIVVEYGGRKYEGKWKEIDVEVRPKLISTRAGSRARYGDLSKRKVYRRSLGKVGDGEQMQGNQEAPLSF